LHALVRHAAGVSGILHFGKRAAVVGDDIIESLHSRLGSPGDIPIVEVNPSPNVGDTVNITAGAFSGLESVITQVLSGKDRVRILIDFLGRQVEAEIGKASVVRAGAARTGF
jgi:transcriptional antiterminator RfaH